MLVRSLTFATLLAVASPLLADDAPLAVDLGKSRPLIVIAPSTADPTLRTLNEALKDPATKSKFEERNLVLYSVAGMVSEQQQALSLGHEVRKAGRWGVVSTSGQVNTDASGTGYVRGVTRWQKDDPNRLVTYQAGDVFAGHGLLVVGQHIRRDATDPAERDIQGGEHARQRLVAQRQHDPEA